MTNTHERRDTLTPWNPEDRMDAVSRKPRTMTDKTRAVLMRARDEANVKRSQDALRRSRLILDAIDKGASDADMARWLGVAPQSVPVIRRRAKRRVETQKGK